MKPGRFTDSCMSALLSTQAVTYIGPEENTGGAGSSACRACTSNTPSNSKTTRTRSAAGCLSQCMSQVVLLILDAWSRWREENDQVSVDVEEEKGRPAITWSRVSAMWPCPVSALGRERGTEVAKTHQQEGTPA